MAASKNAWLMGTGMDQDRTTVTIWRPSTAWTLPTESSHSTHCNRPHRRLYTNSLVVSRYPDVLVRAHVAAGCLLRSSVTGINIFLVKSANDGMDTRASEDGVCICQVVNLKEYLQY